MEIKGRACRYCNILSPTPHTISMDGAYAIDRHRPSYLRLSDVAFRLFLFHGLACLAWPLVSVSKGTFGSMTMVAQTSHYIQRRHPQIIDRDVVLAKLSGPERATK